MKKNYKQRNWLFKLKTVISFGFILIVSSATAQLNGTYTIDSSAINSGTNYQSFTDFADTITKYGVSGTVIVNETNNLNGTYSVDLSVVADGVYFVQVKNGDYFATKRITVSK